MAEEYNLKEIQTVLLSMMKDVHRLCIENKINYSLTGGSLLGAIRENGFIPWDDDIDIMVDRVNYEKLRKVLSTNEKYQLGRGPWLQHIKPIKSDLEIEPYIDVFIMDHLPDKAYVAEVKIFLLRILQGMLKEQVEYEGFSAVYKVCIFVTHILGKLVTRREKLKLYDKVSQLGNKAKSEFVSITNDSFGLLKVKHKSDMLETFVMHGFEDTELMVINNYDAYLTARYGSDYMTPPPEAERAKSSHYNRPKVKDESVGV